MKPIRILSIIMVLAMVISLFACKKSEDNDMQIDETALLTNTFHATDKRVKALGRNIYDEKTGILWLIHSASCAEFTVNGTKLSVNLVGDGTVFGDDTAKARVAIYLDGERIIDHMMSTPEVTLDVFDHPEAAEHTVKIIKLSEANSSVVGIQSIEAECYGLIKPTEQSDIKIEFIGDSITCAYGVDDEVKEHGFSTETEDATKSYAFLTAQELGADYSLYCYSGNGIISGYTGDGNRATWGVLPDVYTKIARGTSADIDVSQEWDFNSFEPDYIVINLGTNDNSYVKGDKTKAAEYAEAYAEFIKDIRKLNKDAHIICALGVMGDELFPSIEEAVKLSGDKNISTLRLSGRAATDPIAADWHPAFVTQQRAAGELTEHIRGLMK